MPLRRCFRTLLLRLGLCCRHRRGLTEADAPPAPSVAIGRPLWRGCVADDGGSVLVVLAVAAGVDAGARRRQSLVRAFPLACSVSHHNPSPQKASDAGPMRLRLQAASPGPARVCSRHPRRNGQLPNEYGQVCRQGGTCLPGAPEAVATVLAPLLQARGRGRRPTKPATRRQWCRDKQAGGFGQLPEYLVHTMGNVLGRRAPQMAQPRSR